jgi:hypothetical protein
MCNSGGVDGASAFSSLILYLRMGISAGGLGTGSEEVSKLSRGDVSLSRKAHATSSWSSALVWPESEQGATGCPLWG